MKKSTKKTIVSLFIILIFGFSIIAFAFNGLTGGNPQQQGSQPLNSTVVDVPINSDLESTYIQHQYTFLRFHYSEKNPLFDYIAQLPQVMTVPSGEVQLIVNRLPSNETRAEIVNLNGAYEVSNLTEQGLLDALCQQLMFTPTDCLVQNITFPSDTMLAFNDTRSNTNVTVNQTNETPPQL